MRSWLCIIMALCLLLTACTREEAQMSSALGENEVEQYGKVISAYGNEVTLQLGSVTQSSAQPGGIGSSGERPAGDGFGVDREGFQQDGKIAEEKPEAMQPDMEGGFFQNTRAEDVSPANTIPKMSNVMTSVEGGRTGEDLPLGEFPEDGAEMPRGGVGQSLELTLRDETATYLIPVGTPVTVSIGQNTITTNFTQLQTDQNVKLLLRNEESGTQTVLAVQILG